MPCTLDTARPGRRRLRACGAAGHGSAIAAGNGGQLSRTSPGPVQRAIRCRAKCAAFPRQQDLCGCRAQIGTGGNSGALPCGQTGIARGVARICRGQFLVASTSRGAATADGAGRHHPPYRLAMGSAHPFQQHGAALFLTAAAARILRRTRRSLSRIVLLGFLLHDAGIGAEWARRIGRAYGARLCLPDRLVWSRAERHPQLLSEPVAAALLLRDGRARECSRSCGLLRSLPAAAAPGVCFLDAGGGWSAARHCASPGGRHARGRDIEPLLG